MKKKKQKVAIITGASRGIGKAIALKLDKEGFITVLVSRSQENLKSTLKDFSKRAITIPTDVSKEEEVVSMVEEVIRKFGRIDVLVNNAGFSISKTIDHLSKKDFEEMTGVNLGGAFYCCREVIKQMKKQPKGGQIINISSIIAKAPFFYPSRSLYCMVKAGIGALGESLGSEVRNANIKIATIYPGIVFTKLLIEQKTREPKELQKHALKPEDIAHIVWMIVNQGENSNIAEVIVRPRINVPRVYNL